MRRRERERATPARRRLWSARATSIDRHHDEHMQPRIPSLPEQASTLAPRVDNLYFFMLAVSGFFAVLVTVLVDRLRHQVPPARTPDEVGAPIHGSLALELIWTGIPFILAMVMFVWGASVYFALARVARPRRSTSTPSASSGCGSSSTARGSARSTAARAGQHAGARSSSRPRTCCTICTSRRSA